MLPRREPAADDNRWLNGPLDSYAEFAFMWIVDFVLLSVWFVYYLL